MEIKKLPDDKKSCLGRVLRMKKFFYSQCGIHSFLYYFIGLSTIQRIHNRLIKGRSGHFFHHLIYFSAEKRFLFRFILITM